MIYFRYTNHGSCESKAKAEDQTVNYNNRPCTCAYTIMKASFFLLRVFLMSFVTHGLLLKLNTFSANIMNLLSALLNSFIDCIIDAKMKATDFINNVIDTDFLN